MKLMISLLAILLITGCRPREEKKLDTDFEGTITYHVEDLRTNGMDSADTRELLSYLPKDSMIVYFDEGRFIAFYDSGKIDFAYLDPHRNIEYDKLRDNDSLLVFPGGTKSPLQEDILDVLQEKNTDTILGYVCNRLTIKTRNHTRTLLYAPEIATNPEWYKHTKSNFYDVLYKNMKAYYLAAGFEYKNYAFTFKAIRINPGKVSADIFPDVNKFPHKKMR